MLMGDREQLEMAAEQAWDENIASKLTFNEFYRLYRDAFLAGAAYRDAEWEGRVRVLIETGQAFCDDPISDAKFFGLENALAAFRATESAENSRSDGDAPEGN